MVLHNSIIINLNNSSKCLILIQIILMTLYYFWVRTLSILSNDPLLSNLFGATSYYKCATSYCAFVTQLRGASKENNIWYLHINVLGYSSCITPCGSVVEPMSLDLRFQVQAWPEPNFFIFLVKKFKILIPRKVPQPYSLKTCIVEVARLTQVGEKS